MGLGRCAFCKGWKPLDYNPTDDGLRIKFDSDGEYVGGFVWGECDRITGPEGKDSDMAFVQDASMYSATLYTKPEFGCVLFKKKQEQ